MEEHITKFLSVEIIILVKFQLLKIPLKNNTKAIWDFFLIKSAQ